jgi:dUTP pyrophosphatase
MQEKLKIKIKKTHKDSILPKYSKPGDAGMDLYVADFEFVLDEDLEDYRVGLKIDSGIAVEIPEGYVGLVFPRSSIKSTGNRLSNSVGVIDSGYRGSIKAYFDIIDQELEDYTIGDRFAQLIIIPYPQIEFEEVEELSTTERGSGGFGSTN